MTNICLSSTLGFLHENITMAYFISLGDWLSALFLRLMTTSIFLFNFLRDQNSQHFNEDLLGVNASAFSFVLCFKATDYSGASQRLGTSDWVSGQRAWREAPCKIERVRSASLCQLILLGCCCCMWTINFPNNIDFHTGSTNPNNQVEQRRLKLILLRIIRKQSNKHIFIEWNVNS